MRVVLATSAPILGGVSRHILDLGGELRRAGYDVVVGHHPDAAALVDAAHRDDLETVELARAQTVAADVLHLHLADTYDRSASRTLAMAAARRPGMARVITEHLPRSVASDPNLGSAGRTPGAYVAKTWFKRMQFGLAHRVIAVSAGSARFLESRYAVASSKLRVVENGIRSVHSSSPGVPSVETVWAVGELGYQKGPDILIAAAALSEKSWHVNFVGDGLHRAALERQAASTAAGRVSFLGRRSDVEELLASGGVSCLPSRWEACPYSTLESMRAGLATVATRVDGLEDVVVDQVTGLLVDPESPQQVAQALDRLCGDPALAAQMGAAGQQRQADRFTIERMVAETVAVYGSVG